MEKETILAILTSDLSDSRKVLALYLLLEPDSPTVKIARDLGKTPRSIQRDLKDLHPRKLTTNLALRRQICRESDKSCASATNLSRESDKSCASATNLSLSLAPYPHPPFSSPLTLPLSLSPLSPTPGRDRVRPVEREDASGTPIAKPRLAGSPEERERFWDWFRIQPICGFEYQLGVLLQEGYSLDHACRAVEVCSDRKGVNFAYLRATLQGLHRDRHPGSTAWRGVSPQVRLLEGESGLPGEANAGFGPKGLRFDPKELERMIAEVDE